jgi:hypothetical protein
MVLMDYVNIVVHVFQNKLENITTSKACGEMQNYHNSKQILKNRMAKENNPNPNKFKVSPWLVYSYFTYFHYQCNW